MCGSPPVAVQFQVLYTTQLTQKRKKWHDGQCNFYFRTSRVRLLDNEGRLLTEERWSNDGHSVPELGETVVLERYIVELDSLIKVIEAAVAPPKAIGKVAQTTSNLESRALQRDHLDRSSSFGIGSRGASSHSLASDTTLGALVIDNAVPEDPGNASVTNASPLNTNTVSNNISASHNTSTLGTPVSTRAPAAVATPKLYTDSGQNSLSFILKHEVGRLTPYGSVPKQSPLARDQPVKRLKYAPWGDPNAVTKRSENEYHAEGAEDVDEFGIAEAAHYDDSSVAEDLGNSLAYAQRTNYNTFSGASNHRTDSEAHAETQVHEQVDLIEPFEEDWDLSLTAPLSYELDSDLESEPEIVDFSVASQSRVSMFEDIPLNAPKEGPWTKEAYILFSWHPPVVKQEIE